MCAKPNGLPFYQTGSRLLESVDEERESTPVHDDDDDEPSVRVREDVDVPIYPAATVVVVIAAAGRTGPQSGVLFDKA